MKNPNKWLVEIAIPTFGMIIVLGTIGQIAYQSRASSSVGFHQVILPVPECQDKTDNDNDRLTDFPEDIDCESGDDESEKKLEEQVPPASESKSSLGGNKEKDNSPNIPVTEDNITFPRVTDARVDFNSDSEINMVDFALLIAWLGHTSAPTGYDLTGNGQVTLRDVSILVYHWTE